VRLGSASRDLAESFERASSSKRREAARLACELAAASSGLIEPEAVAALSALRAGSSPDPALRAKVEALAAKLDDEYLRLNDEGAQEEALRLFSKARAASALVFASAGESSDLHEAIYEAISAMDDADVLQRRMRETLQ
jgi:hypothetical protein